MSEFLARSFIQTLKKASRPLVCLLFACPALLPSARAQEPSEACTTLWYASPARDWNSALPLGNGRLAAMAYGTFPRDRLQLNEETLWEGEPVDRSNPKALSTLPQLREMLFSGRNADAAKLIDECFVSPRRHLDPYQSAGELLVDFVGNGSAPATGPWMVNPKDDGRNPWIAGYGLLRYKRRLDLPTGIASSEGKFEHVMQQREAFVSATDDLICYRVTCDKGGGDFDLSLQRELDVVLRETPDNGYLVLDGRLGRSGRPFVLMAEVRATGGTRRARGSYLEIRGADAVEVRIAIATDYLAADRFGAEPRERCRSALAAASGRGWDELKERHVGAHKALFDRVSLKLGEGEGQALPTDARLAKLKAGGDDPSFYALYFNYGRYLLAGSSREGGLPANLQGKWCGDMSPAWNSNYTTNINLQMNYWPAGPCNLGDRAEAYLRWAEFLTKPGARTARQLYGCGGWALHHNSDIYGATEIFDGPAGMWTLGSAWVSLQLVDLWRFNQDREWLARTWPLAKGAAEFVLDFLVEAPAGSACPGMLVTSPSVSPENTFRMANGETSEFTYAATMDLEIIRELFAACRETMNALGVQDEAFARRLDAAERRLPPLKVSPRTGALQEWIEDYEEVEPGHRHVSHLFGVYPGTVITREGSPELFAAARKSLDRRLAAGGGGTGWSRAWIINFAARFRDGALLGENLQALLAKSTLPNLFDNHPPFQIDGNFGGCAGIAEGLLQSHLRTREGDYILELLPARPPSWKDGEVRGLKARGGVTVDLQWREGRLAGAWFTADRDGSFSVRYGNETRLIALKRGARTLFAPSPTL